MVALKYQNYVVPAPDYNIRGQATAGTQFLISNWIPACTGMTTESRRILPTAIHQPAGHKPVGLTTVTT